MIYKKIKYGANFDLLIDIQEEYMEKAEKEEYMEKERFKDEIARDGDDISAAANSNSKQNLNSKILKTKDDDGETNPNPNKGKSCKGCLYYSSALKSDSRNPLCVGITRSLPQGQYIYVYVYVYIICNKAAFLMLKIVAFR